MGQRNIYDRSLSLHAGELCIIITESFYNCPQLKITTKDNMLLTFDLQEKKSIRKGKKKLCLLSDARMIPTVCLAPDKLHIYLSQN
jgi:hypothetical protein